MHYGAEIILDTAIFWESRVQWNQERHSVTSLVKESAETLLEVEI
ncbi:hypothetical protein [Nostoc sp. DSM 114161]